MCSRAAGLGKGLGQRNVNTTKEQKTPGATADKSAQTGELVARDNLEQYKHNLLQNVKYTASKLGGKVRVSGKYNERMVRIEAKDGRFCKVWFPFGPRVKNVEIDDLKDGCEWILGVKPFSI